MVRPVLVRTVFVLAAALGCGVAGQPAHATTPASQGIAGAGSIVYVRNGDLYLKSPDGTKTQRVTWDGASQTADHTGGPGYLSPSQTDSGLIVAIRNQKGEHGYNVGWLWVMNRQGAVIRKFRAPQDTYSSGGTVNCSPIPWAYQPYGLYRAVVSPDGSKIAYVERGTWQDSGCGRSTVWSTFVVGIGGGSGQRVRQGDSNLWYLEAGSWATNTRLVLDKSAAGEELLLYADAPAYTAKTWYTDSVSADTAVETPSIRHGIVATAGFSGYDPMVPSVMRLWTTSGPPAAVTPRCEDPATGGTSNPKAYAPSVSPDGTGVVWFEQGDSATEQAGEGVYVMAVGNPATSCPTGKVLLAQGGYSPFWGPAAVTTPPPASLRINSVSTKEGNSGTHSEVFTVTRTGNVANSVSVTAKTKSGTATSGVDFTAVTTRLSFAPGQRTRTVAVPVKGDRKHERNETYRVNLSAVSGARLANTYGVGTIVNDD